jgi:hypothetical protein
MLSGEATNANYIVFGLTPSGLEPMIYFKRGKYAYLYTTYAVYSIFYQALIYFRHTHMNMYIPLVHF